MLNRTYKVALTAVLTVVMVVAFAGVALAAPPWTDISPSVLSPYSITEAQLAQISEGFVDGSWGPYKEMPRRQFVKMAVAAFDIPLRNPATPTFTDVPATNFYFQYIEAATAANLIEGTGGNRFEPDSTITREQAAAIIVRWVAAENGFDLATFYTDAEAAALIAPFNDEARVGPNLVEEMAFAVDFKIVLGTTSGNLEPKRNLLRIQGAAMLIRSGMVEAPPATTSTTLPSSTTSTTAPGTQPLLLLTPATATNPVGDDHTVTAKLTTAGVPVKDATVTFVATKTAGDASAPATITVPSKVTDASGTALGGLGHPSTYAATYTITATAIVGGATVTSNDATKTWQRRVVGTVALVQSSYPAKDPTTAAVTNPIDGGVGVDHTVTATVKDQFGATMDATVTFNWTVTTGNPSQSRIAEGTAGPAGSGKSMDSWAGPGTNIAFNITATADGVTSNTLVKKWATRVLTTATLLPASGVNDQGGEDATVTVTLKDQFNAPVDRSVTFTYKLMVGETDVSVTASHDATTSATTGQFTDAWNGDDNWGPATVVVTVQGSSLTATATKYWAEGVALAYPTVTGGSGVEIPAGLQPASGTGVPADVLWSVTQAVPFITWPVVGSGPYISGSGSTILTSHTWNGAELVFVHFPNSTNIDLSPNWVFAFGSS